MSQHNEDWARIAPETKERWARALRNAGLDEEEIVATLADRADDASPAVETTEQRSAA